jgi:hypothetical protein
MVLHVHVHCWESGNRFRAGGHYNINARNKGRRKKKKRVGEAAH